MIKAIKAKEEEKVGKHKIKDLYEIVGPRASKGNLILSNNISKLFGKIIYSGWNKLCCTWTISLNHN